MAADENDSKPAAPSSSEVSDHHKKYWQANIRLVLILLCIWFLFGCVFSILLVDKLNEIRMGGFKLGFWISQQGTILVFIALVFVYAFKLQKLDREHGVEDDGEGPVMEDH